MRKDLEGSGRGLIEVISQHMLGGNEENYEKRRNNRFLTRDSNRASPYHYTVLLGISFSIRTLTRRFSCLVRHVGVQEHGWAYECFMDSGATWCETYYILLLYATTSEVMRTSNLFLFTSLFVFVSYLFLSIYDMNTFQNLHSTHNFQGSECLSSVPPNNRLTAPRRTPSLSGGL
jgi:hypothetical protein